MRIKKALTVTLLSAALLAGGAGIAHAETVYYKGSAISWDHGRSWGVTSYSSVQSGAYEHSATANTTFSGWKAPGVLASAEQWVGTGSATAYWNARG
ncbi:hypothetical protein SAMN06295974_1671 [Plantibacter flavus]|uniref:Lactococcin 972 family bacteriocin n=1 Tax=Plantibacter flavus TaxID=150123 RepID=A0A3N2C825_9MICO|nr:hypothetical protein EDD42_3714 [Plantibacter flavus]SMG25185.1 hypothetical protein SAMN06295974_1671 [Plantibacter flavus]